MSELNLPELFALAKKGTPGPWEQHPEDSARILGEGLVIAHILGRSLRPLEQHETNAMLIVTSVNALSAIEKMVEELTDIVEKSKGGNSNWAIDELRAILKNVGVEL